VEDNPNTYPLDYKNYYRARADDNFSIFSSPNTPLPEYNYRWC